MIAETETLPVERPKRPHPTFTTENAREYALRGNAKRWSREREKKNQQKVENTQSEPPREVSDFAATRLVIIRERIDSLLDELKGASEPKSVMQLCAALDKLASIEQKYSGRPSPGTLKPTQPKGRRSPSPEFSPKPIENPRPSVVSPTSPGVSTDTPTPAPELPPL